MAYFWVFIIVYMLRYISVFSQYLFIIYSQLFLSWDNLDSHTLTKSHR